MTITACPKLPFFAIEAAWVFKLCRWEKSALRRICFNSQFLVPANSLQQIEVAWSGRESIEQSKGEIELRDLAVEASGGGLIFGEAAGRG